MGVGVAKILTIVLGVVYIIAGFNKLSALDSITHQFLRDHYKEYGKIWNSVLKDVPGADAILDDGSKTYGLLLFHIGCVELTSGILLFTPAKNLAVGALLCVMTALAYTHYAVGEPPYFPLFLSALLFLSMSSSSEPKSPSEAHSDGSSVTGAKKDD